MLRKMQSEFETIKKEIIAGSGARVVDIIATPGAGKSSIPIQACGLIEAGLADALLWIVPRSALQNQGERGFMDPFFREMFGHNCLIRESTNEPNPCRGTKGFVTTYQAIGVDDKKTVLSEVKSKRYIIILDEFHHLEKDGVWHESLKEIIAAGRYLIKMTGTLGRGDKKEIAYINYKNKLPYFNDLDNSRMILYSRTDALKEKAILPIEFHLSDGEFEWKRANGAKVKVKSFESAATPQKRSEALFTAINSEFAADLLRACVMSWAEEKKRNPGAKLLIVTADYGLAKDAVFMLNRSIGVKSEIATSHESKNAIESIKNFKSGACACLVTIAMAYEGLDVPGITHICVLTNIRAREWIEQMLARGVRIDKAAGPYESQRCNVFAPRDKAFKRVVDLIKKQQVSAIEFYSKAKEDQELDVDPVDDEEKETFPREEITPISSKTTDSERFLLGLDDSSLAGSPDGLDAVLMMTVKEQERALRTKVSKHINKFSFDNRYEPQRINREIKEKFTKARKLMDSSELKRLMAYVKKNYPVEIGFTLKDIPGISLQRGKSKRVTAKVEPWTGRSEILKQSCYDPIHHLL